MIQPLPILYKLNPTTWQYPTGSKIDPEGVECYRRLVADSGHVNATIEMMTHWNLEPLLARADQITAESLLFVGGKDRAVAPQTATQWAKRLKSAEIIRLPDSGHLPHEEDDGTPFLAHLDAVIA